MASQELTDKAVKMIIKSDEKRTFVMMQDV
jgi:hypothetical protein